MIFWHEREPVLSIDVHPSGFIATAGADKKVRVSTVRAPRMPVYACSLFVICLMHSQWAVSNLIASLAWNSCVEYIYEILSALCVCVRGLCCLALRCARGSHVHLHACFSTFVCSILQTCQEARLRLVTVLTCRPAYTKSAYCVFTVSCVLDTPHTVHYTLHAISGPRAVMYHACIMHPPCTHRERNTSF